MTGDPARQPKALGSTPDAEQIEKLQSRIAELTENLRDCQRNVAPWDDKLRFAYRVVTVSVLFAIALVACVVCETWGSPGLQVRHMVLLAIGLIAIIGTTWGAFWYTRTLR